MTNLMITALVLSAIIIFVVFIKSGHFFRAFFLSSLSGISALFAVNILSGMTGINVGINAATLTVSALGGIPSVIGILLCRLIFLT